MACARCACVCICMSVDAGVQPTDVYSLTPWPFHWYCTRYVFATEYGSWWWFRTRTAVEFYNRCSTEQCHRLCVRLLRESVEFITSTTELVREKTSGETAEWILMLKISTVKRCLALFSFCFGFASEVGWDRRQRGWIVLFGKDGYDFCEKHRVKLRQLWPKEIEKSKVNTHKKLVSVDTKKK